MDKRGRARKQAVRVEAKQKVTMQLDSILEERKL